VFVGAHVIIYSSDADADRAFIRDVLGFPNVDAGAGWLIFKLPPAEIAVHPTEVKSSCSRGGVRLIRAPGASVKCGAW
jgi:catechol 2,3-dioxygenase-like lactoylglutathione lyase family enzyme